MVIAADMGAADDEKNQQFRIVDVNKSMTSITITANHIWADLSNIPLKRILVKPTLVLIEPLI